jgi:hypothetical protein
VMPLVRGGVTGVVRQPFSPLSISS